MAQTSLKKNAVYNTVRSGISFLFPIISYSYASRAVGVDSIGQVNWTLSIISYFTLLAVFGMATYGVRECAGLRGDREAVSRRISELFAFNLLSMIISVLILAACVLIIIPLHAYAALFLVQGASIIFTVIGMDWVNVVFEDYRYITLRGLIINVLNLSILFLFVHSPEDYLIYALLTVLTPIVTGVLNFLYLRRYVDVHLCMPRDVRGTVRTLWPFFVNDVSIAVYVGADTILLGAIKDDHEVGIYSTAVKVYTIVKSVFIAIFSVTIPRLSYHASRGEDEDYNRILSGTVSLFILLAFPAMTGLMLYAEDIVVCLSGEDYIAATLPLRFLAVALLFAVFGGVATNCYNVPRGLERLNGRIAVIAAIENTILNIPAIWLWGVSGAAFTTLLAELTVLGLCLIHYRREHIPVRNVIVLKDVTDALIGTAAITAIFIAVRFLIPGHLLKLIVGIVFSVPAYFGILVLRRNEVIIENISKVFEKISKK